MTMPVNLAFEANYFGKRIVTKSTSQTMLVARSYSVGIGRNGKMDF